MTSERLLLKFVKWRKYRALSYNSGLPAPRGVCSVQGFSFPSLLSLSPRFPLIHNYMVRKGISQGKEQKPEAMPTSLHYPVYMLQYFFLTKKLERKHSRLLNYLMCI